MSPVCFLELLIGLVLDPARKPATLSSPPGSTETSIHELQNPPWPVPLVFSCSGTQPPAILWWPLCHHPNKSQLADQGFTSISLEALKIL